jgi:rhodanese-related sulfurtransferase
MHNNQFLKLVNEAKARVPETTVDAVAQRLRSGERLTLVDVREDREWEKGHIQGASHLGKGVIERDAEKMFPDPNQELILYCGGGYRSALAADALRQMGYTRTVSMDGGWREWNEKGLPVEGESK